VCYEMKPAKEVQLHKTANSQGEAAFHREGTYQPGANGLRPVPSPIHPARSDPPHGQHTPTHCPHNTPATQPWLGVGGDLIDEPDEK